MLKRFELRNFKNFKDDIVVDFSKTGGYKYNTDCITNDMIGKMLIYGRNATGKTNLGKAIMDINHEIINSFSLYDDYIVNADISDGKIYFSYCFIFDKDEVIYNYFKNGSGKLISEKLLINNKKIFECNFEDMKFDFKNLKQIAAETVNSDIYTNAYFFDNDEQTSSELPFLKWLLGNAAFPKESVMIKLRSYIESMSYLTVGGFEGIVLRRRYKRYYDILEDKNELVNFEKFLNEMGVECSLTLKKLPDGQNELYFKHKKPIPFLENASSGTITLMNLYFRFVQKVRLMSFIYLDEFDAFYHYEMADNLVKYFKKNFENTQIIMTTHNTNLMTNRLMRPDCIFILSRWGSLTALCDATERELREGHNLEKMYISGEFEKYE